MKAIESKINNLFSLICCFGMMMAVAVVAHQSIFGHKLSPREGAAASEAVVGDTLVVNSANLNVAEQGFAGPVPVELRVVDGKVQSVTPLPNDETPSFMDKVAAAGLFTQWDGMSVADARAKQADAVAGATFTSRATIANVNAALDVAAKTAVKPSTDYSPLATAGFVCSLAVVLLGTVLPLFRAGRRFSLVQQLLNIGVLGFWTGTFLSYSLMVKFLAQGFNALLMLVPVIMLVTAFVFPLFGRPNHYCSHICPYGSLQDLAGRLSRWKLPIGPRTTKTLRLVRVGLWCALMVLMWLNIWFEWMPNEIFSAFRFEEASLAVVIVAAAFVLVSVVVPRPFCRFVCPTGSLFKIAQNTK